MIISTKSFSVMIMVILSSKLVSVYEKQRNFIRKNQTGHNSCSGSIKKETHNKRRIFDLTKKFFKTVK